MPLIRIFAKRQAVIIGDDAAAGVDTSLISPDIRVITFDQNIPIGSIVYCADSETGVIPPLETITSLEPWMSVVEEAEEIIFCQKNPKTFYSTIEPVGRAITVSEKGWPQPENSTEQEPPSPPSQNTKLYWSGEDFVWCTFPFESSLEEAKTHMCQTLKQMAYSLLQPTDWYVIREFETGTETPLEVTTWRGQIREQTNEKEAEVNSKVSKEELDSYCQSGSFLSWVNGPL